MANNYYNFTIPYFCSQEGSDWTNFTTTINDNVDYLFSKTYQLYWLIDPSKMGTIALEKSLKLLGIKYTTSDSTSYKKYRLRRFIPDFVNKGLAEPYLALSKNITGEDGTLELSGDSNFKILFNTKAVYYENDTGIVNSGDVATTALNSTDIALVDQGFDSLRTYRFNGAGWRQVGNSLSVNNGKSLAALNSTDVACFGAFGAETLRTYRFDGTDWSQVGNGLNVSNTIHLTALNSTDIAVICTGSNNLKTYRFNGTDWSQVGNALTVTTTVGTSITALNSTEVALINVWTSELRTYRFDGTDWSTVGNALTVAGVTTALATLNSTDIVFIDYSEHLLKTYRFDGTDWSQVGSSLNIPGIGAPALAALNSTDIAFMDSTNDTIQYYRFNEEWFIFYYGEELDKIEELLNEKTMKPAFYRIFIINDDNETLRVIS